MARNQIPNPRRGRGARPPTNGPGGTPRDIGRPVFAQPEPTEDPTTFRVRHPSDDPIYKQIDELNREHLIHSLPFAAARAGPRSRTK